MYGQNRLMKSIRHIFPALMLFCLTASVRLDADTVKDREGSIRNDRKQLESGTRWKYNDLDSGFAEARRTGKPLMVALRCVPCLACSGIDTEVLLENDDIADQLDKFVCVRLINANSLDLAKFQFDFDLSYSVLFFNGDGTLYGRFGSWVHQKDAQEKSTTSFIDSINSALDIHRNYPQNRDQLQKKQATPMPWKTPADMPSLAGKYTPQLSWDTKLVQSCVHCHQIGDALRKNYQETTGSIPTRWIYPHPEPETLGLSMSESEFNLVEKVVDGSPASQAGIETGDRLISLDEQALLSAADIRWALHQLDDQDSCNLQIDRSGTSRKLSIHLPEGWKEKSDISRRVGTWPMRAMAFGGMFLEDLDEERRREADLNANTLALFAKHVGQYGEHAVAKKAGIVKGDIIISMAGVKSRFSESRMIGYILKNFKPGDTINVSVLRNGSEINTHFKVQ